MSLCSVSGSFSWHWQIALREGKARMNARYATFAVKDFLHTKMQKAIKETLTRMQQFDRTISNSRRISIFENT
jgi:hypothetical protein